jgi:hypothetical protein
MELVLQLWQAFVTLWLRIPGVRFAIRYLGEEEDGDYRVALVEDPPDTLRARTLYVFGARLPNAGVNVLP